MADDPCECVWSHEAAMRRLLSLLRDSQTECTDGECSTAGGMFSGPQGIMMWSMLWGMLALAMFFLRPRSNRNLPEPTEKGPQNESDNDNHPPPGVL